MKIVQIKMDKERNLKFGMNTVMQIEKALGKPIAQIGEEITIEGIFQIAYYGLKWEDKKLKFEDIGDLFDEANEHYGGFDKVVPILMEAFTSSFGGSSAMPSKK